MDELQEQDLFYGIYSELYQKKEILQGIQDKSENFIKEVCKYASGRMPKNEYSKMYNDILKKSNWTIKQKRVIFNHLLNNLMTSELEECIKKAKGD